MSQPGLLPEEFETFRKKIQSIKIANLTTIEEDGDLHGRPMYTQEIQEDGIVWFFAYFDSHVSQEIRKDNRVALSYSDESSVTYVNASGTAEVVRDKTKIDELWKSELKAYFENGKDDPNIALIKINIHQAEYWDRPGGKIVTLFQLAKAAITGAKDPGGRNEKLGDEPS